MVDFFKNPIVTEYKLEAKALVSLAGPIIATAFLSFLLQVVDLAFVGILSLYANRSNSGYSKLRKFLSDISIAQDIWVVMRLPLLRWEQHITIPSSILSLELLWRSTLFCRKLSGPEISWPTVCFSDCVDQAGRSLRNAAHRRMGTLWLSGPSFALLAGCWHSFARRTFSSSYWPGNQELLMTI